MIVSQAIATDSITAVVVMVVAGLLSGVAVRLTR